MNQETQHNQELFETRPVPKALMSLAIPTIISQLVVMIYNLADTFFIGKTDDPYKVAAASMAYVLFFMLNALANLFGIGGGSLMSRLLGEKKPEQSRSVCAFSFWGEMLLTAVYGLICLIWMEPILRLVGASDNTIGYASSYVLWVVVVGGIPASMSMTLSHFFRSAGLGKIAGLGLTLGGVLNIALDPLFMFVIFPSGMEVTAAAVATCVSNCCSLIFYLVLFFRHSKTEILSADPRRIRGGAVHAGKIFGVGIPSAISTALLCGTIMVMNGLVAGHGDIPLAAVGIVNKIQMLPHNVGMGLCQGMVPLVAYNFSAGNYPRMKSVIRFTGAVGVAFSFFCIALYLTLAEPLSLLFIREAQTLELTAAFLRVMVLATPMTTLDFHLTYTLQAMGKGRDALLLSVCRQGLLMIPLMFLLDVLFGIYGVLWSQFFADSLTLILAFWLYRRAVRRSQNVPAAS